MILRHHRDVETAAAVIDFDDALHVGLHRRLRQGAARLRLHFGFQLLVLGLLVALEGDPVDHRVLHHRDDQPAAGVADAHVGKQSGRVKRLEAFVDLGGTQLAAWAGLEIGADGGRLDPPVAFNDDGIDGLRNCDARRRNCHHPGNANTPPRTAKQKPAPVPTAHTVPCATRLFYLCGRPRCDPSGWLILSGFVQRFSGGANETPGRSFPFPSKSCTPATVTTWPGAGCH